MWEIARSAGLGLGVRLTRISLRAAGFRTTVALLGALARIGGRPATKDDIDRWVEAVNRAAEQRFGASCLDRSVFLWFLMRRRHVEAEVRIGVAFDGDRLDGHAWVEVDGAVVNDDPDVADRFSVFEQDPTGIVFP